MGEGKLSFAISSSMCGLILRVIDSAATLMAFFIAIGELPP